MNNNTKNAMKKNFIIAAFISVLSLNAGNVNGTQNGTVSQELSKEDTGDSPNKGGWIPFSYDTSVSEQGPNGCTIVTVTTHCECISGGAQNCKRFEYEQRYYIP